MINPAIGYMICHNAIEQNKRNRENALKSNIKTVHSSFINDNSSDVNLSDTSKTESTITQKDMNVCQQQIEMTKNLMKILNPELDI